MATPYESGQLNLQLFDLRREPVLREARSWFLTDFNPETMEELIALISDNQRNASFRMVLGYWDMAASMVTTGAIDGDAFRAAHGEVFLTFAKIHPFIAQLRSAASEPDYCKHLEAVVLAAPDAEGIMTRRRGAALAAAKARQITNAQAPSPKPQAASVTRRRNETELFQLGQRLIRILPDQSQLAIRALRRRDVLDRHRGAREAKERQRAARRPLQ
jgi:hypothetical protein